MLAFLPHVLVWKAVQDAEGALQAIEGIDHPGRGRRVQCYAEMVTPDRFFQKTSIEVQIGWEIYVSKDWGRIFNDGDKIEVLGVELLVRGAPLCHNTGIPGDHAVVFAEQKR